MHHYITAANRSFYSAYLFWVKCILFWNCSMNYVYFSVGTTPKNLIIWWLVKQFIFVDYLNLLKHQLISFSGVPNKSEALYRGHHPIWHRSRVSWYVLVLVHSGQPGFWIFPSETSRFLSKTLDHMQSMSLGPIWRVNTKKTTKLLIFCCFDALTNQLATSIRCASGPDVLKKKQMIIHQTVLWQWGVQTVFTYNKWVSKL